MSRQKHQEPARSPRQPCRSNQSRGDQKRKQKGIAMPLDRDLISSSSPIACRDRWSFAESKPPANRVVSTNEFWTDPESDDYVPEAVPEMMMISRMAI